MGGDSNRFEYPDEAGYPDGMGVLHEGTDDVADDEISPAERSEEAADAAESDLENFAMQDEEDDEGV